MSKYFAGLTIRPLHPALTASPAVPLLFLHLLNRALGGAVLRVVQVELVANVAEQPRWHRAGAYSVEDELGRLV